MLVCSISDFFRAAPDRSLYEGFQDLARERVSNRDPDDWPIVAVALLLDLPIWTEDQDFFVSAIATWTTDTVELYLRGLLSRLLGFGRFDAVHETGAADDFGMAANASLKSPVETPLRYSAGINASTL